MERFNVIDLAKFLFAIVVISIHAHPFQNYPMLNNAYGVFTRLAVPFFFVSSAFFLFRKYQFGKGGYQFNKPFMLKFLKRTFVLYLVATIVYLFISPYPLTLDGLRRFSLDFTVRGVYSHLWFLPALMFSVFVMTVMLNYVSLRVVFAISATFFAVGTLLCTYAHLFDGVPFIHQIIRLLNSTIGFQNGLFYGLVFVALGALLTQTSVIPLRRSLLLVVLFLGLLVVEGAVATIAVKSDARYLFFSLLPLSWALFSLLLQVKMRDRRIFGYLRKYSTNTYIFHYLFIVLISRLLVIPKRGMVIFVLATLVSVLFAVAVGYLAEKRRLGFLKYLY